MRARARLRIAPRRAGFGVTHCHDSLRRIAIGPCGRRREARATIPWLVCGAALATDAPAAGSKWTWDLLSQAPASARRVERRSSELYGTIRCARPFPRTGCVPGTQI